MSSMTSDQRRRIEQGQRLQLARVKAGYRSARDAALSNGWPESSYRAHENGTRTIGQDDAERYGRRFSVSAQSILFGDGKYEDPIDSDHQVAIEFEALTEEDKKFIGRYVDLHPAQKIALKTLIDSLTIGSRPRKS